MSFIPSPQEAPLTGPGIFCMKDPEELALSRPEATRNGKETDIVENLSAPSSEEKAADSSGNTEEKRISVRRSAISRRRRSLSMVRRKDTGERRTVDTVVAPPVQPDAQSSAPESAIHATRIRPRRNSIVYRRRQESATSLSVAISSSENMLEDAGEEIVVTNTHRVLRGAEALPVGEELQECIENRLQMHEELSRLARFRRMFRKKHPTLPEEALREVRRQDEEGKTLPLPGEKAARIPDAAAMNAAPELDTVLQTGEQQRILLEESAAVALPAVFARAYAVAAKEPLAEELTRSGIDHRALLGGGVYYLALEMLREEARGKAEWTSTRHKEHQDEAARRGNTVIRRIYTLLASKPEQDEQAEEEGRKLRDSERSLRNRAVWISREMAFLERLLVREYRRVYAETAVRYLRTPDSVPVAVRAFLRYGAISFKPWWMPDEVKRYLVMDCAGKVREHLDGDAGQANAEILYADEYLSFIMTGLCSPMPIGYADGAGAEEEAILYYRRVIDGDKWLSTLADFSGELEQTLATIGNEIAMAWKSAEETESRGTTGPGEILRLRREVRMREDEAERLRNCLDALEQDIIPSARSQVNEAEDVFSSGARMIPDVEELVRGECDLLADIAARLGEGEERFMPLVLRDRFVVTADVVGDRKSVVAAFESAEERDPGVFRERVHVADAGAPQLRRPPMAVILPAFGNRTRLCCGRDGMEQGRFVVPVCFTRTALRRKHLAHIVGEFRTSVDTQEQNPTEIRVYPGT